MMLPSCPRRSGPDSEARPRAGGVRALREQRQVARQIGARSRLVAQARMTDRLPPQRAFAPRIIRSRMRVPDRLVVGQRGRTGGARGLFGVVLLLFVFVSACVLGFARL